jgi:hypothetical protein
MNILRKILGGLLLSTPLLVAGYMFGVLLNTSLWMGLVFFLWASLALIGIVLLFLLVVCLACLGYALLTNNTNNYVLDRNWWKLIYITITRKDNE